MSAAAVVASLVVGYGLARGAAAVGGTLGPVLVVAALVLPLIILAVLRDPRFGLVAVLAVFPVGVVDVPAIGAQVVQVAVLVVAACVVLRRLAAGFGPLPWVAGMAWPLAFVGWYVVALPSALDRHRAVRELLLFTVGLVFAAVIVAACRTTRDIRLFLAALLAVVALVALTTPFSTADVRAAFGGAVVHGRATGIFSQPNQLGTFCTTGALVGIGLLFAAPTRRARLLTGAAVGASMIGLLLSLSRGAWIGFVFGIVVLVAKLPEARRALVLSTVPVVLLAVGVSAFAPTSPQVQVVGQRLRSIAGERNPYDDRPAIWSEARREILVDPVTGHGPGSFPVASTRATSMSRTTYADHAHNLFLTWGAEAGLPAVLLATGFIVHVHMATRRVGRRARRSPDAPVVAALAAALAGVVGQGLVDYTLHNTVVLTVLFALIGAVFAYERIGDRAPAPAPAPA